MLAILQCTSCAADLTQDQSGKCDTCQNASATLQAVLPFSGFYNSTHDAQIDSALEQAFSDDSGNAIDGLVARANDAMNWRAVHEAYAREYAESFCAQFNLPSLAFAELISPREYNFSTDKILCTLSVADVRAVLARVDAAALAELVEDECTSRSGFHSYYSPDVADWGDVSTWESAQVGLLLRALAEQETTGSEGFNAWAECELVDSGNGELDACIDAGTPGPLASRLFHARNYLAHRDARGKQWAKGYPHPGRYVRTEGDR